MTRGGSRPNAGRKPGATGKAKRHVNIRLPIDLIEWLKRRPESQAWLIETALRKHFNIIKGEKHGIRD